MIGIDIRIAMGQRAGIGNYTYNLVRNLAKIDGKNNYILYAKCACKKADLFNGPGENFKLRVFKYPLILWHIRVFLDVLLNKIDIYYTSSFIVPILLPRNRCIIFVPDITALIFAKYHTLKVRILMRLGKIAVFKAKLILTISLNSKKDIISFFNILDNVVKVTYLAASEEFRIINDNFYLNRIKSFYNLPDKFILFVGSIEPRKNLIGLINAFDKIKAKIEHKLVIVGGKGWLNSKIYTTIKNKGMQSDIIFTGYVSNRDLVAIYNLADVFVYPSLYEGFGLPPLEAMACGTPVITSNTSSLPEVVGGAGMMLNPYDISAWASSIYEVLENESLRNQMALKGIEQAKKFSWEKTARETLAVYEEIVRE